MTPKLLPAAIKKRNNGIVLNNALEINKKNNNHKIKIHITIAKNKYWRTYWTYKIDACCQRAK